MPDALTTSAVTLTWLRVGIAIALTAVVLLVGLQMVLGGAVVLMFGGLLGLAFLILVPIGVAAAISVILYLCTGRKHIGASVTVTLIAFVSLGIAFFSFGTVPMIWVQPGFELVYVLIAVPSALCLGLFLGTWPLRAIGAAGLVLLTAGAVWVTAPEPVPDVASEAQLQEDANFEAYVASGLFPMVADVPGGTIGGVVPDGGPPRTLSVTADGGVVEVVIDRYPITTNPSTVPCRYLSDTSRILDETDTLEEYADWCVADGDIWRLTDGTGYARMDGDSLVAVRSAIPQNVRTDEGERPANPAEVLEAWNSLRMMTEAEVRADRSTN